MTDWTSGYVADIGYTFGYYNELNPLRVRLAFLHAGLVLPESGTACELGFGQGLSANVHAAASPTKWFGTDFNPSQAAFACELATVSGSGARLFDESFAEFCGRTDLPEFDFIGLHGIWSWISDENRQVLVDFLRRKLKVGGVAYLSYNTLPGWAAFAPMRHLLTEHAEIIGSEGHGIVNRINGALEFADKLLTTNPAYLRANPQVAERTKKIKDQNRQYLAHEYFNRDWHPMHFANMSRWLTSAKLSFACSAHPLDHIDLLNLTSDQQAFMAEIPDAGLRETVRDFMVNQQFRRDYWVKGPRRLNPVEQIEALRAQRVILLSSRSEIQMKANGALGEASLSEAVYGPVLDLLADHVPLSIHQIENKAVEKGLKFSQILQAIMVLVGIGHVAVVQDDKFVSEAKKRTDKLNRHILNKARGGGEITVLASPVTGGGVSVNRFSQLFLLAYLSGKKLPTEWVQYVWQLLSAQGQKLVKDGKALETEEENLAELSVQAQTFAKGQLSVLKALQIAG